MEYLEERNIGFDVGITKVPLVCESCLFDLMVGDHRVRPDKAMGYAACENAEKGNYRDGNFGARDRSHCGKALRTGVLYEVGDRKLRGTDRRAAGGSHCGGQRSGRYL